MYKTDNFFTYIQSTIICAISIFTFITLFTQISNAQSVQSILALVNDEPISAFDVSERTKLRMLGSKKARSLLKSKFQSQGTKDRFRAFMQENRPQSREEANKLRNIFVNKLRSEVNRSIAKNMKKETLEALIDERLMLQEAKKRNVLVDEKEIQKHLKRIASNNKDPKTGRPITIKTFFANLKRVGVSERTYKQRIRASISFQRAVSRKYGRQFQIGDRQVDTIISQTANVSQNTEFKLQKVTLKVKENAGQDILAKRLLEAEVLRSKFSSCEQIKKLADSVGGVVQALGKRTPNQLPKASRAVFLQAKSGEMTPPDITSNGIELYAICSRRTKAGNKKERAAVKNKLRQKEFTLMRRRYLRDLRQEAFIEYR